MIKSIMMKNCATYPENGCRIENCQKVNFFYGPNGSGKSTISNFLCNPTLDNFGECSIEWENDEPEEILVYNREFRKHHFQEDIDGVFTLGKATIEEINALEQLKEKRVKAHDDLKTRKNSLEKKIAEINTYSASFRDAVWDNILKANEVDFQNAFIGFRANKEKFRDEVIRRYRKSHTSEKTRDELLGRASTLFLNKPEKCEVIKINIETISQKILQIENDSIWDKVIVGNRNLPISKLIDFLGNSDWVNKGRTYLKDDGVCPFCQKKTINKDFKSQLESFFSGEYEKDIERVQNLIQQYRKFTNELLNLVNQLFSLPHTILIGKIDTKELGSCLNSLKILFSSNVSSMEHKMQEASAQVKRESAKILLEEINKILQSANELIKNHNQMVDDYDNQREELINDVWSYLMNEHSILIDKYLKGLIQLQKAKDGISHGVEVGEKDIQDLDDQIREKGANITSVQPTVDEINRSLKAYGFSNFQIVPSPQKTNSYQIQRMDGTLATNTLSEGEETFISFLYFLQFTKGSVDAAKVSKRKILVLDDPICSLDSTVLYIVSSMVKSLIKNIRESVGDVDQIFILTHNVFFHKEASFVDGRTKELNDVNYWIISKDNNITSIRYYGKHNPIKTSYELLWQELKNNNNASLVTTQNIMRRILENYFSILGRNIDDTIIKSFDTTEDQMICRSLISWINDGSHSIPDDLYIDSYTDSIERYKDVFHQIFIKMDHEAHYNMMME